MNHREKIQLFINFHRSKPLNQVLYVPPLFLFDISDATLTLIKQPFYISGNLNKESPMSRAHKNPSTKKESTREIVLDTIENTMETAIFNSRWLLAPFYLGLVISIALLFVKFVQELYHITIHVTSASEHSVIIGILALVDMALVGSLLLMIVFSGYEIFVSKIDVAEHKDRPDWMGKVDFSGLKLKVIGAIVAISAIDLLKTFMEIPADLTAANSSMFLWKVTIHMAFVVSGVLFALMDRISAETKSH